MSSEMAATIAKIDCQNILQKVFPPYSEVIDVEHFQILPLLEKATGFFGSHAQLQIDINLKRIYVPDTVPRTLSLFVKALPDIPAHQKYLEEIGAFRKEVEAFKLLLPCMQTLSNDKKWAPSCFLARPDLLIFENLKQSGFNNVNGLFDKRHLILAAECLARFHCSSFVLEKRAVQADPSFKMAERFDRCLYESLYVNDEQNVRYQWFYSGVKTVFKMISLMQKYDESAVGKIEARIPLLLDRIKQSFKADRTKINVVCHGDLWTNNIMFRYDDNVPVQCRLVDFQLLRYAPNTLDLTCMLVLCSDRNTRRENLLEVLKTYVDAFNSQLVLAGQICLLDLAEVLKDYEQFRIAALMEACLYEMVTRLDDKTTENLLACPDDAEDFFYGDRDKFVLPAFEKDLKYRARMIDLIEEFVDTYVLIE